MIIQLADITTAERQYYLQHLIAPRPIALASTINTKGEVNLSPFSFFNLFSSYPPIVVFSPSRRVRNNTTKHTLQNIEEVPEVVINIVTEKIVHQTSLASCEYPDGVNEFIKAGFTEEKALFVKPPMVKESIAKLECKVNELKYLGEEGGAGCLVIAEVIAIHINDELLDENKKLDQRKLDLVARLGGNWYTVTNEASLFEVEKPNTNLGIGFDQLPASIRNSEILTGNQLAQLANVSEIPSVDPAFEEEQLKQIVQYFSVSPEEMEKELHRLAQKYIKNNDIAGAWQVLLAAVN